MTHCSRFRRAKAEGWGMRHKGIPKWIVLLGWVQIGTDPLEIGKSSFLKGPLIGLWFEKISFKLELRSTFICHFVQNNIAFSRVIGAHFFKSVLGKGKGSLGNALNIVIEADESSPRPQRGISHLDEPEQFLFRLGVIQKVHGHHEINRFRQLERGHIAMQLLTPQGTGAFFFFGQLDHLGGKIDAGDLQRPGLLDFARVKPITTSQV